MREDRIHKIEVHVGCICFDKEKVLILKRSEERKLFPGVWECGGGQVWTGEGFEEAVQRQLLEEAGISVNIVCPVAIYQIDVSGDEQRKIPGMYFACTFEGYEYGDRPKLSREHTEWKWVTLEELEDYDLIPGLEEQIKKAYSCL